MFRGRNRPQIRGLGENPAIELAFSTIDKSITNDLNPSVLRYEYVLKQSAWQKSGLTK